MGTYNRFLGIENELNVFNISNQDVDTLMTLREQGQMVFQGQNSVQGLGARQFSLSDEIIYQTKPDTYGTVELETSSARQVFAEILRVRPSPFGNGGVDFVVPTPLR